jgi:hypothetical protein
MVNPYGITLDGTWTKWATAYGVSETIAAALYLISENRKAHEVVVKLTPGETELVTDIVQHWPDCFPRGAFAALNDSRPTPTKPSAACTTPGAGPTAPAAHIDPSTGRLGRSHARRPRQPRAAPKSATESANWGEAAS